MAKLDSLKAEMAFYMDAYHIDLPRGQPIIVIVEGLKFHEVTKNCERPFDKRFTSYMNEVACDLCEFISGAKFAYVYGGQVHVLALHQGVGPNLQYLVSAAASCATATFNTQRPAPHDEDITAIKQIGTFSAKAFVIPPDSLTEYFIWRQQAARDTAEEAIAGCGRTGAIYALEYLRGRCAVPLEGAWVIDNELPMFDQCRSYIAALLPA